mmetsp:Transcript_27328/g.49492  ORF Transcript_27328/g.49492 Transcript_27328/m.49492 type:complete len:218 (+) Transcript_27328:271-924(+)
MPCRSHIDFTSLICCHQRVRPKAYSQMFKRLQQRMDHGTMWCKPSKPSRPFLKTLTGFKSSKCLVAMWRSSINVHNNLLLLCISQQHMYSSNKLKHPCKQNRKSQYGHINNWWYMHHMCHKCSTCFQRRSYKLHRCNSQDSYNSHGLSHSKSRRTSSHFNSNHCSNPSFKDNSSTSTCNSHCNTNSIIYSTISKSHSSSCNSSLSSSSRDLQALLQD